MCRWLMLTHNRTRREEFELRQEFLAQMLGVHRPTVSETPQTLQQAGLITYARGRMRLLDVPGLAAASCDCLELMETQMDRIFAEPWRELADREDRTDSVAGGRSQDRPRQRSGLRSRGRYPRWA